VEIANGFVPLAEKARDHVASFARSRRQLARVPGFTLIELLVVVAIIAILAAMLLPTLQRAKDRSKQAACMSNMKQFHVALTCFADDNDMRLPLYMWYIGERQWTTWNFDRFPHLMLASYLPARSDVWLCPGWGRDTDYYGGAAPCQGTPDNWSFTPVPYTPRNLGSSYYYVVGFWENDLVVAWGQAVPNKFSRIIGPKDPSRARLMYCLPLPGSPPERPGPHLRAWNNLWLNGHVDSIKDPALLYGPGDWNP